MSREPQALRHQTAAYIPCLSVALSSQFHPPYPYSFHGPQKHKLPSLTLSSLGEELFLGLRMYFLSWCPFSLRNSSMFFKTLFRSKTCTWACVCGGQRLAWASSSITLQLFFFFKQDLSLSWKFTYRVYWLPSEPLSPQLWNYRHVPPNQPFLWLMLFCGWWESELGSSCLRNKHLFTC